MSSNGLNNGDVGSKGSRKSTRDRKLTERFGNFESGNNLEELIEAPESKGEKKSNEKPSLVTKIEKKSSTKANAPLQGSRKRSHSTFENYHDFDEFIPSSSRNPAPKRRRPRAALEEEEATLFGKDERPKPRGRPEVWAEKRYDLCESLPYYQAHGSAAYTWGSVKGSPGFVYGLLVDNDNDEYGYMDEKVVITRLGGGMKANESGEMEQAVNHSSSSNHVATFLNNKKENVPVVLIVGAKNIHCPTKVPHRYNVLGSFHVTDVWAEKVKGKVVCRARFEMIDLQSPSWWGVQGSPLPPKRPDYTSRASVRTCSICQTSSKEVLAAGWLCLNEKCTDFFTLNGRVYEGPRAWNQSFLTERNEWPANSIPPFDIKPAPPTQLVDGTMKDQTSLQAWKGMVCEDCGRCNSRTNWDEWKCKTEGCTYEVPIQYHIVPASSLAPDHAFQAEGHSIPFDKWLSPVVRTEAAFLGFWRKQTFELTPGNFVTHFISNQVINRQPGGADDTLAALQGEKLGMQRFPLGSCEGDGERITKHFAINHGFPYKYIVAMESRGFSEAPLVIIEALNHITWAGKEAVKDSSFNPFNEMLTVGYMEKQEMRYHDDGEKDLGPDVGTWSIGGAATMSFRMKSKHWQLKDFNSDTYNPHAWVRPGSQAWEERNVINSLYASGDMQGFEAAKFELAKSLKKSRAQNGPALITLELKHGDMIVMHGEEIQKYFEHRVEPKGKLRYALTARYIKPENIPADEHWKGEFDIPADKEYDGDLKLFQEQHPMEEEVEEEVKEEEEA